MSLRLELLQVARLAPRLLGESAELVRRFLLRQQQPDGGFTDRSGRSDLYYTVFGLDALAALFLQSPTSEIQSPATLGCVGRATHYLRSFGDGAALDFVHLCCLARCWAAVRGPGFGPGNERAPDAADLVRHLQRFRAADGGFNPVAGSERGTAYGAFLALGAGQDLRSDLPEPERLAQSVGSLRTADGAFTNESNPHSALRTPHSALGSTNATAAAVTVLRHRGVAVEPAVGDWLLARAHPQGGFRATPTAPLPDLLSTATALHALAGLEVSFASVKENCLDFLDSLWTSEGAFHGHWADDHLDTEYTFYGLLALGHLSL